MNKSPQNPDGSKPHKFCYNNPMVISDRIYGDIKITEPVIIEIINSKPVRRLKQISQDGAVHFIYPQWDITRFEHSVGAWYLSHRYNRPIEEQIASLLHDVPHTAFSHVIDVLMNYHNQEFHDRFTKKIILESEIPDICQKNGIDIQKVLHKEDFYLLDNHTPELSVDRWDYFMRDGFTIGVLPYETIQFILNSVKEKNERFYFTDLRVAGMFCLMTISICRLAYIHPSAHGSYILLAEAMKAALSKKIVTEDDFFRTDDYVWRKLTNAHDTEIDLYLERLQSGREFVYTREEEAEFHGPNKARYVDPLVLVEGELQRVSELVPGISEVIKEFKAKAKYNHMRQL